MQIRIRELRQRAKLNQAELAKLVDADDSEISRWERGERLPGAEVIEKIAKVFKVGSWELFLDPKVLRKHQECVATEEAPGELLRGEKV